MTLCTLPAVNRVECPDAGRSRPAPDFRAGFLSASNRFAFAVGLHLFGYHLTDTAPGHSFVDGGCAGLKSRSSYSKIIGQRNCNRRVVSAQGCVFRDDFIKIGLIVVIDIEIPK
jgi:hypothetical protein